uniref:Pentatricopeptide repeat-containing protein n=1 Tax=Kalanchoe fedtschenkoi TaxID=63787 RepID=A0A7N0SZA2_KALFE
MSTRLHPVYLASVELSKPLKPHLWRNSFSYKYSIFSPGGLMPRLAAVGTMITRFVEGVDEKPKCRWIEIGSDVTREQKEAIGRLSPKLSKRCLAVLKQIICYSPERWSLEVMLASWAKIMKPRRTDWLVVLKKLKELDHPLYFQVAELALLEESFEPHIRDYTKIIHGYGKGSRLQDAENMLSVMNSRGFACDQVSLTAMIDMYSKAGHLRRAEETFDKIKLLANTI